MTDPLEVSRRKLTRAKEHLADFELQIATFIQDTPYETVTEPDPENAQYLVCKARFRTGLPDSLINAASDCVHNLRTALDSAVYSTAVTFATAARKPIPKQAPFPFGGSAIEFENNLKGWSKELPNEIRALFRAFKPYKGGDDILWALNKISNTDKHGLLSAQLRAILGNVLGEGGLVSLPLEPVWDGVKSEIEFATIARDSYVKYHIELDVFIAFDKVDVISSEPALRVLDYCVSKIESILMAIEAESKRLGFVK